MKETSKKGGKIEEYKRKCQRLCVLSPISTGPCGSIYGYIVLGTSLVGTLTVCTCVGIVFGTLLVGTFTVYRNVILKCVWYGPCGYLHRV